jgi:hypothetical protein
LTWNPFRRERRQISDPVFGRLEFIAIMRDASKAYWEGANVFPPTESRVEYFVDADEEGPGEPQRSFLRRVEEQWETLQAAAGYQLATNHLQGFGVTPPNIWAIYHLTSISIPRAEHPKAEWELSFESTEEGHLYTVQFVGWRPLDGVRMDG